MSLLHPFWEFWHVRSICSVGSLVWVPLQDGAKVPTLPEPLERIFLSSRKKELVRPNSKGCKSQKVCSVIKYIGQPLFFVVSHETFVWSQGFAWPLWFELPFQAPFFCMSFQPLRGSKQNKVFWAWRGGWYSARYRNPRNKRHQHGFSLVSDFFF